MLKLRPKLIRKEEGRGIYAPAFLLARRPGLLLLLKRLGRASRGHLFAGAGVIAAAVALVSVLTWYNGINTPLSRPMEAVAESVLPQVLEQVDEQVATLLGVEEGSVVRGAVLRSAREGLAAASSAIPGPVGGILREVVVAADRSSTSSTGDSPAVPSPAPVSAPNDIATPTTPGDPSSSPTSSDEPSPTTSTPSPATEEPPPTTSEPPASPPPPTTGTPPPATEEPPPPTDEPAPPPPTGA